MSRRKTNLPIVRAFEYGESEQLASNTTTTDPEEGAIA